MASLQPLLTHGCLHRHCDPATAAAAEMAASRVAAAAKTTIHQFQNTSHMHAWPPAGFCKLGGSAATGWARSCKVWRSGFASAGSADTLA